LYPNVGVCAVAARSDFSVQGAASDCFWKNNSYVNTHDGKKIFRLNRFPVLVSCFADGGLAPTINEDLNSA